MWVPFWKKYKKEWRFKNRDGASPYKTLFPNRSEQYLGEQRVLRNGERWGYTIIAILPCYWIERCGHSHKSPKAIEISNMALYSATKSYILTHSQYTCHFHGEEIGNWYFSLSIRVLMIPLASTWYSWRQLGRGINFHQFRRSNFDFLLRCNFC